MIPPRDSDAGLVLRRDALTTGWSDEELARFARAGQLSRVRRGAYVDGQLPTTTAARHALLIAATVGTLRRPAVISHQSAAVLLGLPLWDAPLDRVHITRTPPASSQVAGPLRCHVARLRDDEVTLVGGFQVTDVSRTVLDLARSLPFEAGVVTVDAALHEGLIAREFLEKRLFDIAGTRGSRHAARVVRFADERSASVGESRSRVALRDLGLSPSALQFEIRTPTGAFVARTDFAWEEEGVVGEFDGRIKYGRLLRPGQDAGDAVFEEKRREDAVRDLGWEVVRWTWGDLSVPARISERVERARARGARNRG
jgi:predicted transcriptional regulator of viral defense system